MKLQKLIFPGLLSVFVCNAGAAAEPKLGRERDGTPYRVDTEGNRISDYIAELEVTSEDLRRQVIILEEQLKEKQKNLQSAIEKKPSAENAQPTIQARADQPAPCAVLMKPLQQRIETLEQRLAFAEQQAKALAAQEQEQAEQDSIEGLRKLLSDKDQEIDSTKQELELAQADVHRLNKLIVEQKNELTLPDKNVRLNPLASLSAPKAVLAKNTTASTTLLAQLDKIEKMYGERENLVKRLISRQRDFPISTRPLVTRDGQSYQELKLQTRKILSKEEARKIEAELLRMESILQQDIKVLTAYLKI